MAGCNGTWGGSYPGCDPRSTGAKENVMPSLIQKRPDILEYAGAGLFGLYFAGIAAVVGAYLQVF